ncbi:MAG: radical SAM protein [Desulfovibrionaceae bacterium]|nr:radical SAM protein [Desulfovibrionaceae bacterium]MBF0513748.1 radical SAM protein [Desulfovibrionaceae bacterium]
MAGDILRGRAPGQAVIQYTDRCNASCVQCGMRRQNPEPRSRLGVERAGALIERLASRGVRAISLTGGEPLLYLGDVAALARLARRAGVASVRTGTNGFIFQEHAKPGFSGKIAAAAGLLRQNGVNAFWISLDSPEPSVHERNRGLPGVVDGIRAGLPVFHAQGLYPAVNLGLSRLVGGTQPLAARDGEEPAAFTARCEEALSRFFSFALELGFTTANVCYPMHESGPAGYAPVYAAADSGAIMDFTALETAALLTALDRTIAAYRGRLRIFAPRSSILALLSRHAHGLRRGHGCLGGRDFVFIDAKDMRMYPCGYRGNEPMEDFPAGGARRRGREKKCELCDWECFRDPSNLLGPLLELRRSPARGLRRLLADKEWAGVWLEDLAYFRACGWFDATRAPEPSRMAKFERRRENAPAAEAV